MPLIHEIEGVSTSIDDGSADILRTLQLFIPTGSLGEIRGLNCRRQLQDDFTYTQSGYFDSDHLNDAATFAREVSDVHHAVGVYIVMNPPLPALLARSANKGRRAGKGDTTKDAEILQRRFMLVDCDPIRPAGISSNEAELHGAESTVKEVGLYLEQAGFARPVIAMSGNGYHLLYRIDLPNDDGGSVERILKALDQRFSSVNVKIDTSVHNAARITKLYGTMAKKGDAIPDRPHRRSRLIEFPEVLEVTPREKLEAVASQYAPSTRAALSNIGSQATNGRDHGDRESPDLEAYLQRNGVPILKREETADATRFFIECPHRSDHTTLNADTDCCVTQDRTGKLGGKCLHNSCGMENWAAIKGAIGPITSADYPKRPDAGEAQFLGGGDATTTIGTAGSTSAATRLETIPGWKDFSSQFRVQEISTENDRGPSASILQPFAASHRVTVDAVTTAGGIPAAWPVGSHAYANVAFPVFATSDLIVGAVLFKADGHDHLDYGKPHLAHNLKGSKTGIIPVSGWDRIKEAEQIWLVNNIIEALMLADRLPRDHAVIASSNERAIPNELGFLAGKSTITVGAADVRGQKRADEFAAQARSAGARDVKRAVIPASIVPENGQTLLQYLQAGGEIETLLQTSVPVANVGDRLNSLIQRGSDLVREFPDMREMILEGLLRRAEIMNIVASPKTGKSWLALELALSIVCGKKWLSKFWATSGRVLLIDNELHRETIAHRLKKVAEAMTINLDECGDGLMIVSLRGELMDLKALVDELTAPSAQSFDVVIIDAWYRVLPEGCDENSNADIARLYNLMNVATERTKSAIVCIHHTSKGNQTAKGTTDVGSGAGSQSRAADCHLVIRSHEVDGAVVVDAAVRSFIPMQPFCMRRNGPVWELAEGLDPADLKPERPRKKRDTEVFDAGPTREERQAEINRANRHKVLETYSRFTDGETKSVVRDTSGVQTTPFNRINATLLLEKKIEACEVQKSKRTYPGFRLTDEGRKEYSGYSDTQDNANVFTDSPDHRLSRDTDTRETPPPLGGVEHPSMYPDPGKPESTPTRCQECGQSAFKQIGPLQASRFQCDGCGHITVVGGRSSAEGSTV